jgi:hypothetical protein
VDLVAIGIGFEVNPHRLLKKTALRQQEFEWEAATSKNFFMCQIGVFPTENGTFCQKFSRLNIISSHAVLARFDTRIQAGLTRPNSARSRVFTGKTRESRACAARLSLRGIFA